MVATFKNTVSILVKAYIDGTLLKGDCHACAVGNICAAAMKVQLTITPIMHKNLRAEAQWGDGSVEANWQSHFMTGADGQQYRPDFLNEVLEMGFTETDFADGKRQMATTGYSIVQLARIEYAFETAAKGYTEEAEFAGLMAVVDVLADIHGIDLATAQASKLLFVKA